MPRKSPYARIAITLPQADLAAADQLARDQDRPRSWIIAEAIRQYVASGGNRQVAATATAKGEAGAIATGLGDSRRAQLLADLRLTPEARVRAAEETARVAVLRRGAPVHRVVGFERYEDYLAWKRREELGR